MPRASTTTAVTSAATTTSGRLPQRNCACAATGASCARCTGARPPLQRKPDGAMPYSADMSAAVRSGIASPGRALDGAHRAPMERSFGFDFSHVRVHSGAAAAQSAQAVRARAYTVGHHIVLGAGAHDRGLLAHELAHVVQQSAAGGASNPDTLEHEADRAAQAVEQGAPFEVRGRSAPAVLRKPDEGIGASIKQKAIDIALAQLGLNGTGTKLVAAGIGGAIEGFRKQWNEGGTGQRLKQHAAEFSAKDIPALLSGYIQGVIQGVVSPITDLFSLFVMIEQGHDIADKLAQSVLSGNGDLSKELKGLLDSLEGVAKPVKKTLRDMKEHPLATLKMLVEFATSQGPLMGMMEEKANSAGQSGGKAIATSLEEPWQKPEAKETPKFSFWSQPLQWSNQKLDQLSDALLAGVWGKVGNKAGYALGFAAVQVVLLVFSDGIGNLITQIGHGMGTMAKAGTLLGKTLEGVGKFVKAAGTGIRMVEEAVNAVVGLLAKPFLPILEPLLKPFGKAMDGLAKFLRKLFGVAEKDAAHLVSSTAVKAEGALAHAAPPPPPHGGAPAPHPAAPAHAPGNVEAPAAPHAEAPAATAPKPAYAPHAEATANPKPTPGPADGRGKVMAQEPTPDQHHVRVRESGEIELCSPDPCPLLENIYADLIGGSVPMKAEMDAIKALRKTKPAQAAKRSAKLKKQLDALSARNKPSQAALDQELQGFKDMIKGEGGDPASIGARRPGKTANSTVPPDSHLQQDIAINFDERLPVGGTTDLQGNPISLDERMRRATSLDNRDALEAIGNQRTKHVGVDPRGGARLDAEPNIVSLKPGSGGPAANGQEYFAFIDRPLGDIEEFRVVHGKVLAQLEQGGALKPGEMKKRLNAGIWKEVRHPTTKEGEIIADAIQRAGFGDVMAPSGDIVLRALTEAELVRRGFHHTSGGWVKAGAP